VKNVSLFFANVILLSKDLTLSGPLPLFSRKWRGHFFTPSVRRKTFLKGKRALKSLTSDALGLLAAKIPTEHRGR